MVRVTKFTGLENFEESPRQHFLPYCIKAVSESAVQQEILTGPLLEKCKALRRYLKNSKGVHFEPADLRRAQSLVASSGSSSGEHKSMQIGQRAVDERASRATTRRSPACPMVLVLRRGLPGAER